ncbi:UNVERIFIED_ORG: hypothetical protein BDU10_2525 [Burkholderia sp. CF145]
MKTRFLAIVVILLGGCGSPVTQAGDGVDGANLQTTQSTPVETSNQIPVDGEGCSGGTPLRFADMCRTAGKPDGLTGERNFDFYTRVSLRYLSSQSRLPGLPYAPNGWVDSLLKQPARSYLASLTISTKSYTAAIPLITVSHSSGRAGEAWTRSWPSDIKDFPWFLVKQSGENGVADLQLNVSTSETYDLQAVNLAINLATTVVGLTGPENQLVTSLTSSATKARATALDASLSNFMAKSISEARPLSLDMLSSDGGGVVKISVRLPTEDGHPGQAAYAAEGIWQIAFFERRPSIFSDVRVCTPGVDARCEGDYRSASEHIVKTVDMSRVLSFPLVTLVANQPLITVQQYLQQQAQYPNILQGLAKSSSENDASYASFCSAVQNWMTDLGFSSLDSKIISIAAASNQYQLDGKVRVSLRKACKKFVISEGKKGSSTSKALENVDE